MCTLGRYSSAAKVILGNSKSFFHVIRITTLWKCTGGDASVVSRNPAPPRFSTDGERDKWLLPVSPHVSPRGLPPFSFQWFLSGLFFLHRLFFLSLCRVFCLGCFLHFLFLTSCDSLSLSLSSRQMAGLGVRCLSGWWPTGWRGFLLRTTTQRDFGFFFASSTFLISPSLS